MDLPKAPCEVKDVILFDAEKLKQFLHFIEASNLKAHTEINALKTKVQEINELRRDIKEVNVKLNFQSQRIDAAEESLKFHQKRFLEIDQVINRFQERIRTLETHQNEMKTRINIIDDNFKSLKKITDANSKHIENLISNTDRLESIVEKNDIIVARHEDRIKIISSEVVRISEVEMNCNNLKEKMKKKFNKNKLKLIESNKLLIGKFDEIDENLNLLFKQNGIDFTKKINLDNLVDQYSIKIPGGPTVFSLKQTLDELNTQYLIFKDEVLKKLEKEDATTRHWNIKGSDIENNKDVIDYNEINSMIDYRFNKLSSELNEMKENEKFFIEKLTKKIEKEDLQKLYKTVIQEMEKAISKLSNNISYNKQESQIKISKTDGKDKETFITRENNNQTLEDENESPVDFEIFRKFEDMIDKNTSEINKVIKSIAIMNEKLNLLDPEKIDIGINKISFLEEGIRLFQLKKKNSISVNTQALNNNEAIQSLNLRDDSEDREMMTQINNLSREVKEKFKSHSYRIEELSNQLENLSGEILGKIKRDLTTESNRILDEFKLSLKSSMSRIEDKLNEKVDKLNLDEIARKIDARLSIEMGRKIDKTDLKKNTSLMNRKIENLESKISKTLVDTLIDLQLDDAPLIVKKSGQADKCGSCNQFIPNLPPNQHNSTFLSQAALNNDNSFPNSKLKTKTRNVNHSVGPFNEDDKILKTSTNIFNIKTNNSSVNNPNLPEIKEKIDKRKTFTVNEGKFHSFENKALRSGSVQFQINSVKNTKDSISKDVIRFNETAERQMNNLLNGEFEKQFINPDTLIRATNKIYDTSIEKKKHI